jgi:hypothetical protein
MGKFSRCRACHNEAYGTTLYKCDDCGHRFCDDAECSRVGVHIFSTNKQICPRCDSEDTDSYGNLQDDEEQDDDDFDWSYSAADVVPALSGSSSDVPPSKISHREVRPIDGYLELIKLFGPGFGAVLMIIESIAYSIFVGTSNALTLGNLFTLAFFCVLMFVPYLNWFLAIAFVFVPAHISGSLWIFIWSNIALAAVGLMTHFSITQAAR